MSEPTSAHLDLDALADVASGEPDATGHLDGCTSCTSRLGELTAAEQRVTAALGRLPIPAVPDDVAARVDAALAAEPALPAARRSRAAAMTALPPPAPGRRWLPAAAAAGVLMVSLAALGLAFQPSGDDSGESSVAADAGGTSLPTTQSGTDYADEAAVAQALPEVLGGTAAPAEVASGGSGELSAESDAGATTQLAPADGDGLARLRTPEGLADCLSALLPPEEPDVQPLALDYAQYEGQPALAVLLPDPDPEKVAVFVVGAGCTQADENLLTFLRVDAP